MRDKLQEYALIADIISAIAVVASLIFVGAEIRRSSAETALNTRAIETSAFYALNQSHAELSIATLNNAEVADIRLRAFSNDPSLSDIEIERYGAYLQAVLRFPELAYLQYTNGIIDEDNFSSILNTFMAHLRTNEYATAFFRSREENNPNNSFFSNVASRMKSRVGDCEGTSQKVCDFWRDF